MKHVFSSSPIITDFTLQNECINPLSPSSPFLFYSIMKGQVLLILLNVDWYFSLGTIETIGNIHSLCQCDFIATLWWRAEELGCKRGEALALGHSCRLNRGLSPLPVWQLFLPLCTCTQFFVLIHSPSMWVKCKVFFLSLRQSVRSGKWKC